ncbi:hypothetical protein GCM10009573_10100 [Agromyces bracchium]
MLADGEHLDDAPTDRVGEHRERVGGRIHARERRTATGSTESSTNRPSATPQPDRRPRHPLTARRRPRYQLTGSALPSS